MINQIYIDNYLDTKSHYIASLDPLNADRYLMQLSQMNDNRDINSLISTLKGLIPSYQQVHNFSEDEAVASVRDLGMFAGSIKKHGLEPAEVVPGLEGIFIELANKTDMVPRDTLIHYTLWNPDDERKRRYTSCIEETKMIESAKIAIPKLEKAIYDLLQLYDIPLESPDFTYKSQECIKHLNGMVEAIVHIIKHVSRKVFAENIRPFFDSFYIDGKEYLGPGAVEMPLFIFDHFLWSAECEEEKYRKFKESFIPYCLPDMRYLYLESINHTSLLKKLTNYLRKPSEYQERVIANSNEVLKLFQILIKFRKPHIKVVDQAYLYAENRQREMGSGGYKADILTYLTSLTEEAKMKLEQSLLAYQNNCFASK